MIRPPRPSDASRSIARTNPDTPIAFQCLHREVLESFSERFAGRRNIRPSGIEEQHEAERSQNLHRPEIRILERAAVKHILDICQRHPVAREILVRECVDGSDASEFKRFLIGDDTMARSESDPCAQFRVIAERLVSAHIEKIAVEREIASKSGTGEFGACMRIPSVPHPP